MPAALLQRLLEQLPSDPRVLLGPGVGHDAAAIDLGDGRVLVVKTDPVTFATEEIGRYVVHVNANDVACLGARPTFFLATALLPEGASPDLAEELFEQVRSTCAELGILPIGGHTEITLGLKRPIIAGMMLGETTNKALIRPDGARAGDHLVITKAIAVEGTALLAREAPQALRDGGVSQDIIDAAARLLSQPGISVVPEAMAACALGPQVVHAMHDPTEGGLATALLELAQASGLQIRLRSDDVPILSETVAICEALGLDPMGLLASGALLVVVAPESCDTLCGTIQSNGSAAICIGDLASGGRAAIIDSRSSEPLPRFERDELARYLESLAEEVIEG